MGAFVYCSEKGEMGLRRDLMLKAARRDVCRFDSP